MSYNFYSVKANNNAKETAYITYMILGSYFKKTICSTKIMEQKLYMYYREMSDDKQIRREEQIINFLEEGLKKDSEELAELHSDASITKEKGGYVITFTTGYKNYVADINGAGGVTVRRLA